jgi:hypothetical protein
MLRLIVSYVAICLSGCCVTIHAPSKTAGTPASEPIAFARGISPAGYRVFNHEFFAIAYPPGWSVARWDMGAYFDAPAETDAGAEIEVGCIRVENWTLQDAVGAAMRENSNCRVLVSRSATFGAYEAHYLAFERGPGISGRATRLGVLLINAPPLFYSVHVRSTSDAFDRTFETAMRMIASLEPSIPPSKTR